MSPAKKSTASASKKKNEKAALFAAGCFWGVEETFRTTPGVTATEAGYCGGTMDNPSYEDVCYRDTGHAEAVRITFDPCMVSYEQLLDIFWANHNPTTKDRQGPDIGSQYRSAIFTMNPAQEAAARASKEALDRSGKWKDPVVTQIVAATTFYKAEDYHQQYLQKRGLGSCHI
jgi:peptide-methionine (S)-S-oxide reductase